MTGFYMMATLVFNELILNTHQTVTLFHHLRVPPYISTDNFPCKAIVVFCFHPIALSVSYFRTDFIFISCFILISVAVTALPFIKRSP